MRKKLGNRNAAAWEQIKSEGLSVDAQVFDKEVYVGFVDNDRWFHRPIGKARFGNSREAKLAANATARAISRETGIPLHPAIPPERLKQVHSYTKSKGLLQWEFDLRKKQEQEEWEESPVTTDDDEEPTIILAVDKEGFRQTVELLTEAELLEPRSPTLREADGDTCPSCSGSGYYYSHPEIKIRCLTCNGSGHV